MESKSETLLPNIPEELALTTEGLALMVNYHQEDEGIVMDGVSWVKKNEVDVVNPDKVILIGMDEKVMPGDFQNQADNPFGSKNLSMQDVLGQGKLLTIGSGIDEKGKRVPVVYYQDQKPEELNDERNW